jgi:antitoxin MazE
MPVLWERAMRGVARRRGSTATVHIPTAVMEAASLSLGQAADVRDEAGRIIIEPIHDEVYRVDELVSGIIDETLYRATDAGPARGREVW